MKILMIHPHDIYDDLEPWTVRITYLAQELVDAGHEITLVYHLRNPSGDLQAARVRQDHEYQTVPFTRIGPGLLRRCFEIEKLAAEMCTLRCPPGPFCCIFASSTGSL
jgi:hypothetical protein